MPITFDRYKLEQLVEVNRTDIATVCRLLGVGKTQSYKYLNGGQTLDVEQLIAICAYYRKPLSIFFKTESEATDIISEPSVKFGESETERTLRKQLEEEREENRKFNDQLTAIRTAAENLNIVIFQKKSRSGAALSAALSTN